MRRLLSALCLALATGVIAEAKTIRYVSDSIEIPLRSGASLRHKIVRMLPSGMAVEVLDTDNDKGFSLVKAVDGTTQGWMPSQYLMEAPAARDVLSNTQAEFERIRSENASLKQRLDTLATQKGDVESSFSQLSADNHRLGQELAQIRKTAANAIVIDQQNKELQERVVTLERELQIVQQENQSLSDRSARDWFLLGSGVLLAGVVVGLILPRLRVQRRSRWGEL
ncbi:TIGR04211 family SH3 domain-containing protein [Plasticicumulans acidivorans]|uniref:SH3 domain protein n=1 Tax=Plasticicumulans acidivorans TaxID=886464 RepID=A0A317MVU1_9GAMM|nr:TIGR04211 family SH3 domain-containing protein [Plasticicumulans acidivorans]PWV62425.1 SH3 domain protein [Plasticicumulans acidivorans]